MDEKRIKQLVAELDLCRNKLEYSSIKAKEAASRFQTAIEMKMWRSAAVTVSGLIGLYADCAMRIAEVWKIDETIKAIKTKEYKGV